MDVETIGVAIAWRNEGRDPDLVFDAGQHRIFGVRLFLVAEIHARLDRPRLMPRATIQKVMCGAISRPSLNGTRPGLIVSKTNSPLSMLARGLRPQPVVF